MIDCTDHSRWAAEQAAASLLLMIADVWRVLHYFLIYVKDGTLLIEPSWFDYHPDFWADWVTDQTVEVRDLPRRSILGHAEDPSKFYDFVPKKHKPYYRAQRKQLREAMVQAGQ